MLLVFQILFAVFAISAVLSVLKKRKEGLLGKRGASFWSVFWLVAIVVVFIPETASVLAVKLGIGRGSDLVIYVSTALIFYLLFRLNVKVEGLARGLTKVTREDAIKNVEKNNK